MSATRDIRIHFSYIPTRLAKELADLVIGHLNYQLKSKLHFHDGSFGDPIVEMRKDMGRPWALITSKMPEGFYNENGVFPFAMDFLADFLQDLRHIVATGSPERGDGTQLIPGTHKFNITLSNPFGASSHLERSCFPAVNTITIYPVLESEKAESIHADSEFTKDIQAVFDKHTKELRSEHEREIAQLKAQLEVKTQEANQLYDILVNRKAVGL